MKTFTYIFFILVIVVSNSIAGELEGGIFNSSSTLQIKMKPTGSSFNSQISQSKFAIKYLTSYGVTFASPVNPTTMTFALQETKTSGLYTYGFYAWTGAYTPNWSQNSENLVMEVTISGGIGTGDFFLVSGEPDISGSGPNWYVESSGLTGGNSVELYQASTSSVPLPVELSSFTASINQNAVNLKWQTKTEINNYGFEVERKVGNGKLVDGVWEKIAFVNGHGNSNSPKDYSLTDKNPSGGSKFIYRLKQIDNDGKFEYSKEVEIELVPDKFELYQNYPNPFNPVTNIKFAVPKAGKISIDVYNILGEKVRDLITEFLEPGIYNIPFDGKDLGSGAYIYRLQAESTKDGFVQVKKMLLIK